VRAVRTASIEELAKAPGMNKKAAEQVAQYFAQRAAENSDLDANVEGRTGDADLDAVVDYPVAEDLDDLR